MGWTTTICGAVLIVLHEVVRVDRGVMVHDLGVYSDELGNTVLVFRESNKESVSVSVSLSWLESRSLSCSSSWDLGSEGSSGSRVVRFALTLDLFNLGPSE